MEVKSETAQIKKQDSRLNKFKHCLNTTRAENLILLIYTAFSFLLILVHEPWRDEAQFWLLARDASLPEILGIFQKKAFHRYGSLYSSRLFY